MALDEEHINTVILHVYHCHCLRSLFLSLFSCAIVFQIESKPSPLTLLMQACNNIGRDPRVGVGLNSVNHVESNLSTVVASQPFSVTHDLSTSPTSNLRTNRKESSIIRSSCDEVQRTEHAGLNGENTSGLHALADNRRDSMTLSADEVSVLSHHRKHSKLELSGYDDNSTEVETNLLCSSKSKISSMTTDVDLAWVTVGSRTENCRLLLDSSLSLQPSTDPAVVSKFISDCSTPHNTQLCSRSFCDDTKKWFQTTSGQRRDNNDTDELSYIALKSSTSDRSCPPLSDTVSMSASSGHIPFETSAGQHLRPGYGTGVINTFMSSASSSLFQNILSGTFLNKFLFPPPSSLMFPSCVDSVSTSPPAASTSPLAVGGLHTLLRQAATLAHYQQWCQQHGELTTTRLCLETLASSKSSNGSIDQSSCVKSNCNHNQQIEIYAPPAKAISAAKTIKSHVVSASQNDRPCTISGCGCRLSSADQQHYSPSTFNPSSGSVVDWNYRRLPLSLLLAPTDHASLLTSSLSVPTSSSTSSERCQSTDHVTTPYNTNNKGSADDHFQHLCSWLNTTEGIFCGRRFSSADSLLHHLQTHCTDQYLTSSLLAQHATAPTAAVASSLPTGNRVPPSSSACIPSLDPADLFNTLHVRRQMNSLRSAPGSSFSSLPSRYHPYRMASASDHEQHKSTTATQSSPYDQPVGLESTMSRSHAVRHHLLSHQSVGGALVAGYNR